MRFLLLPIFFFAFIQGRGQAVSGVIADSISRQVLPFATIQTGKQTIISDIDGSFRLQLLKNTPVLFSHIGFVSRTISSSEIPDTIFLAPDHSTMEAVIIQSHHDKVARIIEKVIRNRDVNNPENYSQYECNIYYRMTLDMKLMEHIDADSLRKAHDSLMQKRNKNKVSAGEIPLNENGFGGVDKHLMLVESYTKHLYKKPRTQEIVLASRMSGLEKTWFPNIITNVLPFHLYTNLISLNGKEYMNPLSRNWKERYRIILEDEIMMGEDTLFMLSFKPRENKHFNSLTGFVYINSRGYAISHMACTNADGRHTDRVVKFEHIYRLVNGKWFPQELNYDFIFRKAPMPFLKMEWNGRSHVDSVVFDQIPGFKFDKTHPVKFHDSVDLRSESEWNLFRRDTLTTRDRNTYHYMDSLAKHTPMGTMIRMMARIPSGLIPIGKLDLDINRLMAYNRFEGYRFGLGLYTNPTLSKYFSAGSWAGYGLRDHKWKYGYELIVFPKRNREQSLKFSFQEDYKIPGQIDIHPELVRRGLRNWLFREVDESREYAITGDFRAGDWQFNPVIRMTETNPLHYVFHNNSKDYHQFTSWNYSLGTRFVLNEKRYPFFDYYLPAEIPRYPVIYTRIGTSHISSGAYKATLVNTLAAITWQTRNNKWGKDRFFLEGGLQLSKGDIPKSFLFGGNGSRRSGINYQNTGGFVTMDPFHYYSDRYVAFHYMHDFNRYFWNLKWSKPFIGISHHMTYGSLKGGNKIANAIEGTLENGYHESGLMLNQLLRRDLKVADLYFNIGMHYHWTRQWNKQEAVWVIGFGLSY